MKLAMILMVSCLLMSGALWAQQDEHLSDVRTFQTFYRDAVVAGSMYGEGGLSYANFTGGSTLGLGVQGGYPLSPQFEMGAGVSFLSFSPDNGDGSSGISDVRVSGIYNFVPSPSKISGGGYITLPVGSEDIGQGDLDFGFFGAIRHPLSDGLVLTGTVGLDFVEVTTFEYNQSTNQFDESSDYESSLFLGAGLINQMSEQLHLVGEFVLESEGDYSLLSGGVDYKMQSGSRLRGGLGIGLGDGAPDFILLASFLNFF